MILTTGKPKQKTSNSVASRHYFENLGLKRDPFSTSPDPYYFFPSRQHQTCLNHLEIGIRLRRGANLVLGEIGTGKTTLCRTLLQKLNTDPLIETYILLNPAFDSEDEFLSELANIFHIGISGKSFSEITRAVKEFLFNKGIEENKTLLLIIDEAQKLSAEALECLRTLLNYETNDYKLLQLIMFGQLQLKDKLRLMPNFVDRLNYKIELTRLNILECARLIHYRLLKAGYPKNGKALFLPSAIRAIHSLTSGYPRKICMLCHNILEHQVIYEKKIADAELVYLIHENESVAL